MDRPRRTSALTAAMLALAALAWPAGAAAKLRVAATVPDLAAIASAVAGSRGEVFSLSLSTQDPHFVDARPHLALKLNRADALLVVGLQLEVGWLPVLLTGARNSKIVVGGEGYLDCSTVVRLKEVPRVKVDRSMGDIHPGGNPHYLIDPDNALRVARAVAARLSKLDPDGKATYDSNLKAFERAVAAGKRRWRKALASHTGTPLVTFHKSWRYFVEAMGLEVVAHLEPKPGIPPNARHVMRVIRTMRAQKVPVLVQEEYYPDRTARLVARKAGARLVVMPGGARVREGESYIARMDRLVERLANALKGG